MRISDWSSDVCSSDLAKAYLGCIGPHGPPCSTFNEGVPPMIELRPFGSLGAANHGWLDAHHHFSFADYHDPARTNWGPLRVWNDATIAPKTRSEGRRVGKERVRTCISRWSQYH